MNPTRFSGNLRHFKFELNPVVELNNSTPSLCYRVLCEGYS